MPSIVRMDVKPEVIIEAVKRMKKGEREAFLEALLAPRSPQYLDCVREARANYKAKRVRTHAQVFGR